MSSFSISNLYNNLNSSLNKENNLNLYNTQINKIPTNKTKKIFQKKERKNNKEICINKALLIKKCHVNFSSLYREPLSKSKYNYINKNIVNNNNKNKFSPLTNLRTYNIINNNKLISNKNKNKIIKNNNISNNCFKDINYIKYIRINIDIDKITFIQIWWKYIYKIIVLQKNIRAFILKKKINQKLKNNKFILFILKLFYRSFINKIQICYERYYFKKWKEISNKYFIINLLLKKQKMSHNQKQILSINNSFQNNLIYENNKKPLSLGNIKKIVFNNSTILKDNILSPYRSSIEYTKPINIKINIKKEKNIPCNLYTKGQNYSLNRSITNKSIINKNSSYKRSKSNNKVTLFEDNKSFHLDEKTQSITNNLYKNIKEYYNYNINEINPTLSTINFYSTKLNKINNKKTNKPFSNINSNNNINKLNKKKIIISNKKNNNKKNYNEYDKTKRIKNWIPYQKTFGNLKTKTNTNKLKNNYNKNNLIINSAIITPSTNSNRNFRKNKNRSLEFDDNDIKSIKLLLKYKKIFLHWKNIIVKNKIIKKLRLIVKIKHIISIFKLLNIKIFFSKIIQFLFKNDFYQKKIINFNYILLNQYYNKLKEISKKKKLINDIYNKRPKIKDGNNISKKFENKNKKNNKINFNVEANTTSGIYYATQFNQKFSKLLNDRKGIKNNNIIIINNNINNNCQQLISNMRPDKKKGINNNNYYRNVVNNNSMIDIHPTDSSLSCIILNNQSDKSLNSILMNQINEKQQNIIRKKKKKNYLNKIIKIINNIQRKKLLQNYLNQWKTNIIIKKVGMIKNNIIDEKIIHFPKSSPNISNNTSNINNISYNYLNNYNNTYNYDLNHIKNYSNNNSDLMINAMFTENNIKNPKKCHYINNKTLLRNKMFTPSNRYYFNTEYQNKENNNNIFINPLPSRETEPKMVYHKKLFPSFCSNTFKHNYNSLLFDSNYNNEDKTNISFNHNNINMNNIHCDKNILTKFFTNNIFFNRRNNYHLENIDNLLPEEKYGFKKINKIEEREISFSPNLSKKNHSFKNIIKDNYQSINNNNIYINVVENFRSDYDNNNNRNISNINDMKNNNFENNYYLINRSMTEELNLNKYMFHSQSQGFTRTIQRIFGNS